MAQHQGILLLGPTGAGKTPLGEQIQAAGLGGHSFRHFDFGDNLRRVVAEELPGGLFSQTELDFLRSVLESGALLENKHFPIAERILTQFLDHNCQGNTRVVLNGLPRHVGQAEAVGRIVNVHTVVAMECTADVVIERICSDIGGDRAARIDDDREAIDRKLAIFAERTGPLVDHYRAADSRIIPIAVTAAMTPTDAWQQLQQRFEG
jgi:adenylate kinase